MSLMRCITATFVLSSLALLSTRSVSAAPKPAPKFWSVGRCERVLPEQHPGIRQIVCVGSGEPSSCRWTSGHRARLYSELRVFAWYRQANFSSLGMTGLQPGVVRSFTLATRARPRFGRVLHHWGDQYVGWPADFYMGQVRLLGTHVSAAHFRAFVAPLAAKRAQRAQTTNCTAR